MLEQNLKNLISLLLVTKGPKRCSRLDGVHIFKSDALASAKRLFSVSQSPFLQNGALASTACTFCMFMTCVILLDKCHREALASKMSTPLKDFGHFGASRPLIAMRMLRFRIFWSLLGPGRVFWGLLAALWGVPCVASCLLEASGALQLGLNAKEHTHTHTRRQWFGMPLRVSWCTLRCDGAYVEGGRVGMYLSHLNLSYLT